MKTGQKDLFPTLAIVMVALLTGYFLGANKNLGFGKVSAARGGPDNVAPSLVGTKLPLDGVDWSKGQRTLVFALQAGCHFCTESGGFYQRLVQQRTSFGDIRLVAVLPQALDDSRKYLDKIGFVADEIHQSRLNVLGVRGTPTLFLVNRSGFVIDTWNGKLSRERENNVIASLQINQAEN